MSSSGIGIGPIRYHDLLFTTTTSILADGDVIADTQLVDAGFFDPMHQSAIVQSCHVFDGDDQGIAMDIVLLNQNVSVGTENAAVSITDANALSIQGIIVVATGDYVNLIASQYASPQFNPFIISADTVLKRGLWAAAITRGSTPTYAGSLLRIRLGVIR
jgi:hypothetical protein